MNVLPVEWLMWGLFGSLILLVLLAVTPVKKERDDE